MWGCDQLIEVTKTIDVGVIRDNAKLMVPRRGIQFDLSRMGEHLVSEQPGEGNISAPPTELDMAAPPSSSAVPPMSTTHAPTPTSYVLMLLTKVQKLEIRMVGLKSKTRQVLL